MSFNLKYMKGGFRGRTKSERSWIVEIPNSLYRQVNRSRSLFMETDGRHSISFSAMITTLLQEADKAIQRDWI